ncbi:MAG: efflux RND transporter periplasmic adaptor subunit [Spirochaetaceae bacterium]|nr:MAG: efflux RND transporter periplasmic adaptor subunit [Spirochaetaceae bacterium]
MKKTSFGDTAAIEGISRRGAPRGGAPRRHAPLQDAHPHRRRALPFAPILLLTLALILALGGCSVIERFTGGDAAEATEEDSGAAPRGGRRATQVPAAEPAEQLFAVNVTPAVQGQIRDYIEVNGDVQTTTSVDIFSNTAGEVARVHVRVGDRVEAEQLIAEVDASRPGQTFAPSPVRSPIAGTITRLPARVGSQVTPSVPVAQVSRTTELEIVVPIAERFISKVRTGLNAEVRLDAFPDQRFPARVTELNPVVDPLTRTLEIKLRFNRPDPRIRAGMFAEVRIITEQKENVVKVPADVVIRRFGESFVFVVREEHDEAEESSGETGHTRVERRLITPGILIDNTLEVTAGLEPNETVVYQGQALLEDGVAVRVINRFNVLETGGTP